ncbi:MAG: LacI family DNA-binding transcriptional regulator [Caldilineales bacterium]|nr:LacI family DNA-binding transcriptional regulator [Caldilineales bacterium]
MSTIRDVARLADVHPSTVSRVFSGKSQISDATRVRVMEAASELGFQPNAIARSLSTQRTQMLAIVVPHVFEGYFEDTYFSQVMRGLLRVAHKYDYRVLVSGSGGHMDEVSQIHEIVHSRQADGIVVLSNRLDVDVVGPLREAGIPFVLIGKPPVNGEDIAWVDSQDRFYTEKVFRYLLDLGHERIAYVGGDPDVSVTNERLCGYRAALAAAGIGERPEWIDYGFFAEDGGYQAVHRMIQLDDRAPTAYYAANDLMAVGILRALHELDIRVPDEVSVIGTNGSLVSMHSNPPLTTLFVPYADMTAVAASMLIQSIQKGEIPTKHHQVDCRLILRETTGPAPN